MAAKALAAARAARLEKASRAEVSACHDSGRHADGKGTGENEVAVAHGDLVACDGVRAKGGEEKRSHGKKRALEAHGRRVGRTYAQDGEDERQIDEGGAGIVVRPEEAHIPELHVAHDIIKDGDGHEPEADGRRHAAARGAKLRHAATAVNEGVVAGNVDGEADHADDHGRPRARIPFQERADIDEEEESRKSRQEGAQIPSRLRHEIRFQAEGTEVV